jgi:GTP-binding protein EngB required for normal cell division
MRPAEGLPSSLDACRGDPMNESQKRSVLSGFLAIHQRMAEMEALLAQSLSPSAFAQHVSDLSPTERRVVHDYFARVRSTMLACLQEVGIPLEMRQTSLRWALECGMIFLDIAVAEMSPDRLGGYGPLDAAGRAQAVKIQQELTRPFARLAAYLRQGLGQDLGERLARLEAAPASVETLTVLDRIITCRGLVEFRPQLDLIVRRLEAPQFEIAVFGRVSSGKSSLLNHIVGRDVLPVGVTPITAVPTRLVRGEEPAALISLAELPSRTIPVEELVCYASEEGNPGNHKHVTGILVQLPAPGLREEVVLVDTPGIGSLARSGSAETFAYLPRCDLGVVLIDAVSTLTPDDLELLRLLYEVGVPAQVVLSKADLLTPADRQRTADYVREHIRGELGLELPVHPVSTVGADQALLSRWVEHEVEPLLARHRSLTETSLRRKISHLRESVVAVLETLLARQEGGKPDARAPAGTRTLRRYLDEADEMIRQARLQCRDWTMDGPALFELVLNDAAQAVVRSAGKSGVERQPPVQSTVERVLCQRDQMAQELLAALQGTLARTLESLRQTAPPAHADPASIRELPLRGLPAHDLMPLREKLHWGRPWWAALIPRLAVWTTRRSLQRHLGPLLREQVALHDRQLQAWLKACCGQLIELYEAQAEVFREQARRLANPSQAEGAAGGLDTLRSDLRELQENAACQPEEGAAPARRNEEQARR